MSEKKEYDAVALQGDFGRSDSSGNRYVAVELQVKNGDRAGASVTWYGNFGDDIFGDNPPRTRTEWTKLDLQKMGWTGKDLPNLPGLGSKPVRITIEEKDGRPQVKRIYAAGGLAIKNRLTDAEKKALADEIDGKKPAAAPADDSDLPF